MLILQMPVARFVCPYCEKDAEVQVTSVTRSRPCPHCSRGVVLQVAARDRKGKHRALLIAKAGKPLVFDEGESKPSVGPAYTPMPLEGEVFERMKLDPEIRAFRQRLYIGVGVVVVMIVLASVWSLISTEVTAPSAVSAPRAVEAAVQTPQIVKKLPANTVGLKPESDHKSSSRPAGMLTFSPGETAMADAPAPGREDPVVPVMAIVEKFLGARDIEALLETVASRSTVEADVRRHAGRKGIKPVVYETLTLAATDQIPAGYYATVTVVLKDGTQRDAHVIKEPQGLAVDWPSFVALSEMDWQSFMKDTPSSPVLFRVLADEGDRYDQGFAERGALRCLKLLDPNGSSHPPIFAYVERASNVGEELDFLLRQSEVRPLKITLRLHFPADPASHDQVWIDSVVGPGWVTDISRESSQVSVTGR